MGEGNVFFLKKKKKKRLRHLPQSRPTVERTRKMFENHRRGFSQTIRHERNTRKDYEGESFEMCDNGVSSLTSPRIFHGLRYRRWMHEMWDSYKRHVQNMEEDPQDPLLRLEREYMLLRVYYKYAKEEGHHPESHRVLKDLYERHVQDKPVPCNRYFITPEERGIMETDTHLPAYSRALAHSARRSKCIAMLDSIRYPGSNSLF